MNCYAALDKIDELRKSRNDKYDVIKSLKDEIQQLRYQNHELHKKVEKAEPRLGIFFFFLSTVTPCFLSILPPGQGNSI